MTRFHWLRLRASAHPTEDVDRVAQAMRNLTGLEPEPFAAAASRTPIEGHFGPVTWVEAELTRAREVRQVLDRLLPPDARAALAGELERRVDDDGVLYLRFGKQAAYHGEVVPTTGEDAVQVRLRVEVHPAGRERAVAALADFLAPAGR